MTFFLNEFRVFCQRSQLNRFTRLFTVGLAVAALLPPSLLADTDGVLQCASQIVNAENSACEFETVNGAGTAGAFGGCLRRADERKGKELAALYDRRIKRSSTSQREALRTAQRAWLKFQAANCDYEKQIGEIEGTSFAYSFQAACLLQSTAIRICEINSFDEYFPKGGAP